MTKAEHIGQLILDHADFFREACLKEDLELHSDDLYLGTIVGVDVHVTLRWDHVKEKQKRKPHESE